MIHPDEAIKAIKAMSTMHGIHYNSLKDATTLMNALINKFPNKSRDEIILALDKQELLQEFKSLPKDLKQEIIKMALATSSTLNEAIKTIKTMSALWGIEYDNLKDFTQLMHILADKFDTTTYDIAQKFNSGTSRLYLKLGTELGDAIRAKNVDEVIRLISMGSDVNFIENKTYFFETKKYRGNTPLIHAIAFPNPIIVKILLEKGANPNLEKQAFESLLDHSKDDQFLEPVSKIRTLLKVPQINGWEDVD